MLVQVFKSSRRAETYLYVPHGTELTTLPEALQNSMGTMELVLGLDLQPERRLARYEGAHVLAAIEEHGFFLQLPPSEERSRDADN